MANTKITKTPNKFTANQISGLVNNLFKQSSGQSLISKADLTGLIAMGDTILSSGDNRELFMDTLTNRIAETIIINRPYVSKMASLIMDDFEWGSAIQKIYIEPPEATNNDSWNLAEGADISTVTIKKPKAVQKLFQVLDTYGYELTFVDKQLRTAFTSPETLAAFISAVYNAMDVATTVAGENICRMCIANFIGCKSLAQEAGTPGVHVINLWAEYKATHPDTTLTVTDCLTDGDFLAFAGLVILMTRERFAELSQVYSLEGVKQHTPDSDLNIYLLSNFTKATATYLQSKTYHDEMVALPGYTEVTYWQSIGEKWGFNDVSAIDIVTSDGRNFSDSGIIGIMFDREAMGGMLQRHASHEQFYPKAEATQHWDKMDVGYFNDLSKSAVVLKIAEVTEV